jgi:hypothetical protein
MEAMSHVDGRFVSGFVITSEARNLLCLALERPLKKQQIPHGLNFTPTSAKTALVGDPGSAVRDDNSKSTVIAYAAVNNC